MNTNVDRYSVFGNPVSHSKSPLLHSFFANETRQNIYYSAECININNFTDSVNDFFSSGGKGLNITVPFKEEAFRLANHLTERARLAGAVNTLYLDSNNEIVGDNTDGIGLVNDIIDNLNWPIKNQRILLVGAGGAARGVLAPIISQSPQSIILTNRTISKAQSLASEFSDIYTINISSFSNLNTSQFDLIINASSASLSGEIPPLPKSIFHAASHCYDMMYSNKATPFLAWAKANSCQNLSDGLGMLVCQGAESFFIWRNVRPSTKVVIAQLRNSL